MNFFVVSQLNFLASFYTYREKAALDLKALQLKRCKYATFLSEQEWKEKRNVDARDSQRIKQHHGRKPIRTVNYIKGHSCLMKQSGRVYQGSTPACLPALILFLDLLNSNVGDAKLMG